MLEKWVDPLGATVKLQINEDDYDWFLCLCIATPVLQWMPKPWTFGRQRSIADALWAVWYGLGFIQCSVCEEFRNCKNKLFHKLWGLWQVKTRALHEHHTTCKNKPRVYGHFLTMTNACKMYCSRIWVVFSRLDQQRPSISSKHKATRTFL